MVDPARLARRVHRLREETAALRRLAARDRDEPLDDDGLAAVMYRFVVAAETCVDAGQHVIASEGLRPADTYADVFTVLGEAGLVPDDLAGVLRALAGFRNVLVHRYLDVDETLVRRALHERLDDLDAFVAVLGRLAGDAPGEADPDEAGGADEAGAGANGDHGGSPGAAGPPA